MPQQPASRSTTVGLRNPRQQRLRRRQQPHRLLVTVAVQQDRPGRAPAKAADAVPVEMLLEEFLEEHRLRGDRRCLRAAPRRAAAPARPRAPPTGSSARRTRIGAPRSRQADTALSVLSCARGRGLGEQALRDQRPAAAAVRREADLEPRRFEARSAPPCRLRDCSSS